MCPWRLAPSAACFSGGIELHPDGEFFFAEDFSGDLEEALEAVANERLPKLADEGELVAQGVGAADGGGAQQVEEADCFRVGERYERPGREVLRHSLRDLAVDGLFGEGTVFKKLLKGAKGLVAVGCPQKEEFFEGSGAVGHAFGLAG